MRLLDSVCLWEIACDRADRFSVERLNIVIVGSLIANQGLIAQKTHKSSFTNKSRKLESFNVLLHSSASNIFTEQPNHTLTTDCRHQSRFCSSWLEDIGSLGPFWVGPLSFNSRDLPGPQEAAGSDCIDAQVKGRRRVIHESVCKVPPSDPLVACQTALTQRRGSFANKASLCSLDSWVGRRVVDGWLVKVFFLMRPAVLKSFAHYLRFMITNRSPHILFLWLRPCKVKPYVTLWIYEL